MLVTDRRARDGVQRRARVAGGPVVRVVSKPVARVHGALALRLRSEIGINKDYYLTNFINSLLIFYE